MQNVSSSCLGFHIFLSVSPATLAAFGLGMMLLELVRPQSGNLFSKCRVQIMNPLTKNVAAALRVSLQMSVKGMGTTFPVVLGFQLKGCISRSLDKIKRCWMTGSHTELVPRNDA